MRRGQRCRLWVIGPNCSKFRPRYVTRVLMVDWYADDWLAEPTSPWSVELWHYRRVWIGQGKRHKLNIEYRIFLRRANTRTEAIAIASRLYAAIERVERAREQDREGDRA